MTDELKPNDRVLVIGGPPNEIGMYGHVDKIALRRQWPVHVVLNGECCYFDKKELLRLEGGKDSVATAIDAALKEE